jgi:hypothetical protein
MKRPSARAHIEPRRVEIVEFELLELLQAKAKVCDAYRAWLADPSRRSRCKVAGALTAVDRLELERGR